MAGLDPAIPCLVLPFAGLNHSQTVLVREGGPSTPFGDAGERPVIVRAIKPLLSLGDRTGSGGRKAWMVRLRGP
jgi:hypothetical protein